MAGFISDEDVPIEIPDISILEPLDMTSENAVLASDLNVSLEMAAEHSSIEIDTASGVSVVAGSNGSNAVTVEGSLSDVQTAFNNTIVTPDDDYFGMDDVTIKVNDLSNGGLGDAVEVTHNIVLNIQQVNDSISVAVPGTLAWMRMLIWASPAL